MQRRIEEIERRPPPFGLLAFGGRWNCESFARYVSCGAPASNQATIAKGFLGVAAVVCIAIASDNRPLVDGGVYRRGK